MRDDKDPPATESADDLADFAIEEQLQHACPALDAKFLVSSLRALFCLLDGCHCRSFWSPRRVSDAGKTLIDRRWRANPCSTVINLGVIIGAMTAHPAFHQRAFCSPTVECGNPFQTAERSGAKPPRSWHSRRRQASAAILICYEQLLTRPMLRFRLPQKVPPDDSG